MLRRGAIALLFLVAALVSSACQSGPRSTDELRALPPAPYKTLLVFSARSVETERASREFWQRLAGLLQWYGTFAELDWIEAHRVRERAQAERIDEGTLLRRLAEARGFDRVIFVWLDAQEVLDEGPNLHAVPSGVAWLALGIPSFFFADRSYGGGYAVGASVAAVNEELQRPSLESIELPELRLTFLDRGFSAWCLIVPPFLLAGEEADWKPVAQSVAEDQLVRTLVERWKVPVLGPSDVRFRFQVQRVDARTDTALLSFVVSSDEELDRVELVVNGATLGQWGRESIRNRRTPSAGGGSDYQFEFQVPLDGGAAVMRVLAQTPKVMRTGTHVLRAGGRS